MAQYPFHHHTSSDSDWVIRSARGEPGGGGGGGRCWVCQTNVVTQRKFRAAPRASGRASDSFKSRFLFTCADDTKNGGVEGCGGGWRGLSFMVVFMHWITSDSSIRSFCRGKWIHLISLLERFLFPSVSISPPASPPPPPPPAPLSLSDTHTQDQQFTLLFWHLGYITILRILWMCAWHFCCFN